MAPTFLMRSKVLEEIQEQKFRDRVDETRKMQYKKHKLSEKAGGFLNQFLFQFLVSFSNLYQSFMYDDFKKFSI